MAGELRERGGARPAALGGAGRGAGGAGGVRPARPGRRRRRLTPPPPQRPAAPNMAAAAGPRPFPPPRRKHPTRLPAPLRLFPESFGSRSAQASSVSASKTELPEASFGTFRREPREEPSAARAAAIPSGAGNTRVRPKHPSGCGNARTALGSLRELQPATKIPERSRIPLPSPDGDPRMGRGRLGPQDPSRT